MTRYVFPTKSSCLYPVEWIYVFYQYVQYMEWVFYICALFSQELYGVKDSSGIWQSYTMIIMILGTYHDYYVFQFVGFFTSKETMKLPRQVRAYTIIQMHSEAGSITRSVHKHVLLSTFIWRNHGEYTRNMYGVSIQLDSSSSAARFRACLISLGRQNASDLDFLQFLSVLPTESPSILDWGLPKFHIPVLIS